MRQFLICSLVLMATGAIAEGSGTTHEVAIPSGDIKLAGRLWLPDGDGPHPAVVFIHGSGQSIRDLELDPDPVPAHLVEAGVAFLAYDKRGVRDSGGVFEPLPDVGVAAQQDRLQILATDAVAAMRFLAQRPEIDAKHIGAWAFSQGGWVASQLEAVGGRPNFLIVVGGPAVSIGEELRYSEIADLAKQRSRAGDGRVEMSELYRQLDEARRQEGEFGGYDPYRFLEAMRTPTLWLLGEIDLSVPTRSSVKRLKRLEALRPELDHRVFARANHGIGTQDAAGQWYDAEEFYQTQFDFLRNLGVIPLRLKIEIGVNKR